MASRSERPILLLAAILAALTPVLCGGEEGAGRPVSRVFEATELHSKGPVLAFAETSDGCLLVASNYLVVFDGLRAQRIDVPGAYAFRGLAAGPPAGIPGGERIWVGAIGAIGYVERDRLGAWNFVSLAPQLRAAGIAEPGEIRFVASVGQGAVFVSDQNVLRWDGRRFESWKLAAAHPLQAAADEDGSVWIYQEGTGLLRLEAAGPPALTRTANALPAGPIEWILRMPGAVGSSPAGMLADTAEGAYRITADGFVRLESLSAVLNGQSAVQAVAVDAGEIAIGTLKDGVVLATPDGEVRAVVNHANGLRDDTVHGLWCDRRAGIWVGLDDDCVRLDSVGDVSIFDAREGLERGLPRKVLAEGGLTYVLTDQALYRVGNGGGSSSLEPVIASHPLLHDAVAGPDGMWVAGMGGLWRIDADGASPVIPIRGDVERLGLAPWLPGGVIYIENHVLKALSPVPTGGWLAHDLGARVGDTPLSLVVDDRGQVWISTAGDGVACFKPANVGSGRPSLTLAARYREGSGLPRTAAHPVLSLADSRMFAFTETQVLAGGELAGFEPAAGFEDWVVLGAASVRSRPRREDSTQPVAYWLAQRTGLSDVAPSDLWRMSAGGGEGGPLRWESLRAAGLDDLGEITSMDYVGGVVWIGGTGGLLRVNAGRVDRASPPRPLQVREIRTDAGGLLDLHPRTAAAVGPETHRIEFGFSAAQPLEAAPTAVFYQTRLVGIETDWSRPQRANTREFTGLPPGSYVFMVRRVDRHGRAGEAVSYPFTVIAPWYRRWPSFALYALALLAGGAGLLRWRLRILRLQTERLDRLVAQRTRELELSNTAKSEFLENISHEIRNPLHGIVGLANVLKPNQAVSEDVARSLKASAEHLRRVSEEVLGFSKLEFGHVSIAEKPFLLGRILREIAELYADAAARQGNALTVTLHSGPDEFLGDEAKIRNIVGNFVANALKYAPGTPVELRADWTTDADGISQVYIAVTDQGPGVPADEQELVFQKFVRGRMAKQIGVVGSGLGLATCRMLARRMGGTVGIESPVSTAPGAPGSTFHLWLPLRRAVGAGDAALPDSTVRRALIVDDEEYNRVVAAGLARELGYAPLTAANAAEALDIARQHTLEVVFIDLELPQTKGDELARELRRLPHGRSPVFIAMTGQDSEAARLRCREAGMDGFVLKPFEAGEVRELIARLSRMRAFGLYARGAGESAEFALERFLHALDDELAHLRAAVESGDRHAVAGAAHRLRTLAALAAAKSLNALSARLQDSAAALPAAELRDLVGEIDGEAGRLKAELAGNSRLTEFVF